VKGASQPYLLVANDEHLVPTRVRKLPNLALVAVADEDAERIPAEPLAKLLAPIGDERDRASDKDLANAVKGAHAIGSDVAQLTPRFLVEVDTHTPC
jgi:hypothetical protein